MERTGGQGGGIRLTRRGKRKVKENQAPPTELQQSLGTGFFVSSDHLLTNWHVVEDANQVQVYLSGGQPSSARVVAQDARNDLALLKTKQKSFIVPTFRSGVPVGEDVAVYGFPFSASGTFTVGNVNAISWEEDAGWLQIQVPVHPGNSGGPVLDQSGNVVAIINAGHSIYQNVNFAIKTEVVLNFLATHRIYPPTKPKPTPQLSSWPTVAEHAKSFSVLIKCNVPDGLVYDETSPKGTGFWDKLKGIFGHR